MVLKAFQDGISDPWSCSPGIQHQWNYRRDATRDPRKSSYVCCLCGMFITKDQLQNETNELGVN